VLQTVSSIAPWDPTTWANQVFLTFDIDWAHHEIIADSIDLVEQVGVAATWFVTNDTPILDRLRRSPLFELGIHPNFNPLLEGSDRMGSNAVKVIERIRDVVPEATSARSHSLVHGSPILNLFVQSGITHDVNCLVPESAGITLAPWTMWDGLVRIPYFWEDDVACLFDVAGMTQTGNLGELACRPGLKVFDFHPIHVFLNTEHLDRYERTRLLHQNPEELIKHRYKGYGTRNRLLDLLALGGKDVAVVTTAEDK
jgi:hypothetical protein